MSNRDDVDAEIAAWERERGERSERRGRRMGELVVMLSKGPAVRSTRGLPILALVGPEMSARDEGAFRVTYLGADGPRGHVTRREIAQIYDDILDNVEGPVSASDLDVVAWTNTPEYLHGSRLVAMTQAENSLRYRASQANRGDWARDVIRRAEATNDPVAATAILEAALKELAVPNPSPPRRLPVLVPNPPWVARALGDSYETINDHVPPAWHPQLERVTGKGSTGITARVHEFGCGAYGCVIATLDDSVVIKITSDPTEAEFATELAPQLAAPICVVYKMVLRLKYKVSGRPVHLMWREAAFNVGKLEKALTGESLRLLDEQHRAGQMMYATIHARRDHGADDARAVLQAVRVWLAHVDRMAKVPELKSLALGLRKVHDAQGIVFGDLHAGNLGQVDRHGALTWVITDPGHVAVVDRDRDDRW